MREQLYRKQPMPPEPWSHEDNPDWILVQDADGFTVLVPVEPCEHGYMDEHMVWCSYSKYGAQHNYCEGGLGDSDE